MDAPGRCLEGQAGPPSGPESTAPLPLPGLTGKRATVAGFDLCAEIGLRVQRCRGAPVHRRPTGAPMTLKIRVIPCLDVKGGRVVKGVQFVDLVDAGDPVEAAKAYDAAGADELTFLDITASHEQRGILFDVVRRR
jgi:hypothetical protein